MSEHSHDIKKEIKIYTFVFWALMVLTVVTVGVSYFHFPLIGAIVIALIIASIKASLVASYFMHLKSEKGLIYIILSLVVVFFLALLFLPLVEHHDVIRGTQIVP